MKRRNSVQLSLKHREKLTRATNECVNMPPLPESDLLLPLPLMLGAGIVFSSTSSVSISIAEAFLAEAERERRS